MIARFDNARHQRGTRAGTFRHSSRTADAEPGMLQRAREQPTSEWVITHHSVRTYISSCRRGVREKKHSSGIKIDHTSRNASPKVTLCFEEPDTHPCPKHINTCPRRAANYSADLKVWLASCVPGKSCSADTHNYAEQGSIN